MKTRHFGIFSPLDERGILGIGFAALVLAVWDTWQHPLWNPSESLFFRFLGNIVFLNSVHVVFTFALLLGLPSFNAWIERSFSLTKNQWWTRVILLWGVLTLLFFAGGGNFLVQESWRKFFFRLLIIAGIVVPHFHSLWQIRGLSLLYDEKYRREVNERDTKATRKLSLCARREKLLFKALYVSFLGVQGTFLLISAPQELISLLPEVLGNLSTETLEPLRIFFVGVNFLIAAALAGNTFNSPAARYTYKSAYMMRVFLFPLAGYSPLAFTAISALHGIEYLFVFLHMTRKAERKACNQSRRWALILSLAFLPFLTPLYLVAWTSLHPSWFLELLSALGIAVVYLHYGLDSLLFRMRIPETRETVGPLLLD